MDQVIEKDGGKRVSHDAVDVAVWYIPYQGRLHKLTDAVIEVLLPGKVEARRWDGS